MTPVEFAAYIRLKTRTNSSTFTDADLLVFANTVKNQVVDRALEVDEDIFLLPTYMNLVANQREYPFYSALLSRIKRVEAKLDGVSYIKLFEIDLTDFDDSVTTEAQITALFNNLQYDPKENPFGARFDIMRNSLWIYSGTITSVTDGLRVWLNTRPVNISSLSSTTDMSLDPSTTTHGIPAALHKVIATGVVIEWKESRPKAIPLTEREQKWEFDLEKAIQTMKKANYDREIIADVPYDDGSEY